MQEHQSQVAVIGAGVIGCAVAWELAKVGFDSTVIDRNGDVGHGSTSASCGIVRRFYSTPTMTGMAQEGAEVWADWRAHLGLDEAAQLAHFERTGMLFIPPAMDEGVERVVKHMRALGVEVEVLTRKDIAERFTLLDTASHSPTRCPNDPDFFDDTGRSIVGGVFEPDAGYVVSPMLATQNLRQVGERDGVRFVLGRRVVAIHSGTGGGRFRVELDDATSLGADIIVNASGPHSGAVNRLAGVTLPLETRALRREVCAVRNPSHSDATAAPLPIVGDLDSGIYFRPESHGRDLIVGSLDPDCDVLEWVDPDECDDSCSVDGFERQVLRLMKRCPAVGLGERRGLAGMYDVTLLDWNPVLDRTDKPGYYVAIGTSGSSFKTAPVIGAVMAQLIESCEQGRDHDRDPLHITLPRTGFELDVAFFSRLRGAHVTTGTVLG
ncbi:MAG: FAD-binding oxidoreductase [bacterium]|nr:FAD-binding oxidoreductase [bacterium]